MDKKKQLADKKISIRQTIIARWFFYSFCLILLAGSMAACSLSEEMKHIEASQKYEESQEASRSTNLTGEQIFIRSCYTCHSGTRDSIGPSLVDISKKYPDDEALKAMIRKGKGMMPAQPANVLNDDELNRLVEYIKGLKK